MCFVYYSFCYILKDTNHTFADCAFLDIQSYLKTTSLGHGVSSGKIRVYQDIEGQSETLSGGGLGLLPVLNLDACVFRQGDTVFRDLQKQQLCLSYSSPPQTIFLFYTFSL